MTQASPDLSLLAPAVVSMRWWFSGGAEAVPASMTILESFGENDACCRGRCGGAQTPSPGRDFQNFLTELPK